MYHFLLFAVTRRSLHLRKFIQYTVRALHSCSQTIKKSRYSPAQMLESDECSSQKIIASIGLRVPFALQRSVEAGVGEETPSASKRERERETVAMVWNCFFINVSVRSCPASLIPRVHIHLVPHSQLTADVHRSHFMLTYNPSIFFCG